jgi:hypothetical protein
MGRIGKQRELLAQGIDLIVGEQPHTGDIAVLAKEAHLRIIEAITDVCVGACRGEQRPDGRVML